MKVNITWHIFHTDDKEHLELLERAKHDITITLNTFPIREPLIFCFGGTDGILGMSAFNQSKFEKLNTRRYKLFIRVSPTNDGYHAEEIKIEP